LISFSSCFDVLFLLSLIFMPFFFAIFYFSSFLFIFYFIFIFITLSLLMLLSFQPLCF